MKFWGLLQHALIGFVALSFIGLIGLNSVSAAQYTMKVAHATLKDAQDEAAILFAKETERLSGGKIKAPVYGASQLGNNPQMNKDVLSGVLEVLVQPACFSVPYIPILGVFDLPGLFPNRDVQAKVLSSDAAKPFQDAARKRGLEIVSFFGGGFKTIAGTFPVRTADDLKGKKIRVMQSPELVGQFKDFGAIGVPMPLGECYTGIQQGVVDGFEGAADVVMKFKLHEAGGYVSNTYHGSLSSFILVNKRWLDSLPADLQKAVWQAGKNVEENAQAIYEKYQLKAWEDMKKQKGVVATEFPQSEREKLWKMGEQTWQRIMEDKDKAAVLAVLKKAVDSYK
jgi:C4-dicarboxylate-binding protein DctP